MRPVRRDEIVDYATYADGREAVRAHMLAVKAARRVHVGPWLTLLFENRETVRYQVQEMTLTERIVKEADIRHELETYNELLGGPGELGATLLIEIDDRAEREVKLRRWLDLLGHLYARLESGALVRPSFDPRQVGEDKLSSVHYVKFAVKGQVPLALGCDHPEIAAETTLTPEQRAALAEDLAQD
jgi:hypothetical protein